MLTCLACSRYLNAEVRLSQIHALLPSFGGALTICPAGSRLGPREYPARAVCGPPLLELAPSTDTVPYSIPPNLRFRIPRDYESPWSLGEDSWDLIHLRMGCGSVSSWPELYQKIFAYAPVPCASCTLRANLRLVTSGPAMAG